MLKHLNTKHNKELQAEKKKEKQPEKRGVNEKSASLNKKAKINFKYSRQLTLPETLEKNKLWDINDHEAQKIHKYIGEMIAVDLQPFSVVEDIGFIKLLRHI